ncbi:hypothetical protein BY458DRAFT_472137 [Sporodiniella umbellata]|nr:hypothetical protein BY458DRAFT_472137 [Sporodiniella umbellata]
MASIYFDDYEFPSELYDRHQGQFTTPVRTLVDFTPHILQELPKKDKDQKPIQSTLVDSWTEQWVNSKSYLHSFLSSDTAQSIASFALRVGNDYLKDKARSDFIQQNAPSKTDKERNKKKEEEEKEDSKKDKEIVQQDNTLVKTATVAGLLSVSLYSAYQAGMVFSDISFHNQLEILLSQVQSIILSTDIWIQEHDKMNHPVPNQIKSDLLCLKALVECIERLDPRSHQWLEAAGWGFGTLGGLSSIGGVILGSTMVATGGAALAVGGILAMLSSKTQVSGKSQLGARLLLEGQVRDKVAMLIKDNEKRKQVIHESLEHKQSKTEPSEPTLSKEKVPTKPIKKKERVYA